MEEIMKLFQIEDYKGESYPDNVILSTGKRFRENGDRNGWYIRLQLPIAIKKTILDPRDFEVKTLPCHKVFLWYTIANPVPANKKILKVSAWKPTDGQNPWGRNA